MDRRGFLKVTLAGTLGVAGLVLVDGCMPRVSEKVYDRSIGQPWRCGNCGYLTRSEKDLTDERCPRCGRKRLGRISEEELQKYL
jgi:DNA-directed RNA polymerase subunit RPC12/RpoP